MGLSALEWVVFLVGGAAAFGFAAWQYGRREERRPQAWLLALLRGSAIAGALFLLFDPSLPAEGRADGAGPVVLLDGSLSLGRPAGSTSLWRAALDSAAGADADAVWLFGGESPRPVPTDSLPAAPPFGASRLAPALRAAAQAGHRSARVITDGELEDATEALEWADRYGLAVEWTLLRTAYPRAAISQVAAPAWAEEGDTVEVRAWVAARGVAAERAELAVRDSGGRVRARGAAPVPGEGRRSEVRLRFPVGPGPRLQRFEVTLEDPLGDEERRDDRRVLYIDVSGPPASPVLLALQPSWEATFLLPSLSRAGDVPAVGYVRIRPDRWIAMGEGFRPVSPAEIRRRGSAAPLLVLVGYGPGAPAWVNEWVRASSRVWVFPEGPAFELPGWAVQVGPLEDGEWYADPTLPPSPITGVLAGIDVELFPPLTGLRRVEGRGAWTPLLVRQGRRGEFRPAVVAGRRDGRRWAVAPGLAYWRWGFRPGAPRDLYRGLMTGVAGWLLEERAAARAAILPVERVVQQTEPFHFLLPTRSDSARLALHDPAGALVSDGGWTRPGETIASAALPVGRYRFDARAFRDGRVAATGSGPVEVEAFHPELVPGPILHVDSAAAPADRVPPPDAGAQARLPLRRRGWPILIVLGLLCAEWILRQRLGLR